jgi:hypothetical protein
MWEKFNYFAAKRRGISTLTTALAVEEFFHPTVNDRVIRRMQAMADTLPAGILTKSIIDPSLHATESFRGGK